MRMTRPSRKLTVLATTFPLLLTRKLTLVPMIVAGLRGSLYSTSITGLSGTPVVDWAGIERQPTGCSAIDSGPVDHWRAAQSGDRSGIQRAPQSCHDHRD